MAINFPLKSVFAVSPRFWIVMYYFSLSLGIFFFSVKLLAIWNLLPSTFFFLIFIYLVAPGLSCSRLAP